MAHTIYNEVTAVTGVGYTPDRVLGKLKTASVDLPYSLDDIKISHNDFAVAEVYNDSIRKLYRNYLYLIANAEMVTATSPTSSLSYINVDDAFTATLCSTSTHPASGNSLSSMAGIGDTHIAKKVDSNEFLYFNYRSGNSTVIESTTEFTKLSTILAGNAVEFNKTFNFKNVISVDTVGKFLFVLDKGLNTLFKFDISGLVTTDTAIRRTGINSDRPGRYLVKTLGGTQYSEIKNRLLDPVSLSVHDEKIYILDNGTQSVKVYDLNFNYITEAKNHSMFDYVNNDIPVSIVVDQLSDTDITARGYILTTAGKIYEYNPKTNTISSPWIPFESYLPFEIYVFKTDHPVTSLSGRKLYKPENKSFNKIVNSKSSKNILYVSTNKNIYKFYKTRLDSPITRLDFSSSIENLTTDYTLVSSQQILSFDTVLYNGIDYMAVTTSTLSTTLAATITGFKSSTYLLTDKHTTSKLYNENFYTNYFTLSDIFVLPQEIVNNITLNKTTKKLVYNHYSFFENLNKKIYSYYTQANLGNTLAPAICTINDYEFIKPTSFNDDKDFYIGVNEPLLTDVVNRPIELLYNQQETLFNLIKEEYLNTEPPLEVPTRLPGKYELTDSVVSLSASSITVESGNNVIIKVLRQNRITIDNHSSSFSYYTVLDTATKTDVVTIPSNNVSVKVFDLGVSEVTITLGTNKFLTGDSRKFKVVIASQANCFVDPDKSSIIVTLTKSQYKYNISLFGDTSFKRVTTDDGFTARVGVQRTTADNNFSLSSVCNIFINSQSLPGGMTYTPVVPFRLFWSAVEGDFVPVPGGTVSGQVSAAAIDTTSTIFFTKGVSSIIFDLSASVYTGTADIESSSLDVIIHRAGTHSGINGGDAAQEQKQSVYLTEQFKTISLFLSSISAGGTSEVGNLGTTDYRADGSSTTLLSCVNIWDALTASDVSNNGNAFSAVSATYPISASFTVQGPLSVFSTDTSVPALYIEPPATLSTPFIYYQNQIDIIVDTAAIGKGGKGGAGALSKLNHYGYDFGQDGTDDKLDVDITSHDGAPGGPALGGFDNYFKQKITITNNGKVYGGAGGGGGGVVGVSAKEMPSYWHPLGVGSGGGGGAGIHSTNAGAAGLAAIDHIGEQSPLSANAYVQNGSVGTATETGGTGGGFDTVADDYPIVTLQAAREKTDEHDALEQFTVDVTTFPGMTGLSGGNIGEAGVSDTTVPRHTVGIFTPTFINPDIADALTIVNKELKMRFGGKAGHAIKSTLVTPVCAGGGTYKGS